MTSQEFNSEHRGWLQIGMFSSLSTDNDNHREFLEAIHQFRIAEIEGLPKEGFPMPDIIGEAVETVDTPYGKLKQVVKNPRIIGNIVRLEYVPRVWERGIPIDGMIIYKPAPEKLPA